MANLKSFHLILQKTVQPDDDIWDFTVPNLPKPQLTNAAGLMKCVSVIASTEKQGIKLRFEPAPINRVTSQETFDRFILISFSDFRLQWPATPEGKATRPATGRENGDYITRMLTTGLKLNGTQYHFFGHSNSQLKSRSCFFFAGTKDEISIKIESMGDLSKLKSVGKKAKRIGLLFSSAEVSLTLSPDRCEDIDDVASKDYIFTDGCGLISLQLARQIAQRRNIIFRNRRYLPSIFQIRYRGYKGVLTLDKTLKDKIQVQFRASMRKFKDAPDHGFAVVDYSKPYAFGTLNDEIVTLLHSLGISQETLLDKQWQYLAFLRNVHQGDFRASFRFLSFKDRIDLVEKLLLEGVESVHATLKSLVKEEYTRMINKYDEQRCRIVIPKSRLLFGVCDPTAKEGFQGLLKDGECFVRITRDGDGRAHSIVNTEVLVTRNPCLHPGDLQKFKAVDVPQFSHLVDCIVFSTRGKRPSADLMSGGDLDGDKFFVTWDREIIPRTIAEAALYPGGREQITFGEVTGDSRAEYFARYTNASLGRVKNLYMKWARLGNAMSPECQQLNRLFSQCVDGNHIRIPEHLIKSLEDPPEPALSVTPFILDVLHEASTKYIQESTNLVPETHDDPDIVDFLLTRDKLAMSEFETLEILLRSCQRRKVDIMEYIHHINFSALTDEQQVWFLSWLPPSESVPALVRNGLLQSQLIYPHEFRQFRLDHPCLHWKPVFRSDVDRMGRFLPTVCNALDVFHKKLILMKVNERLSVAIYIPQKIVKASEARVDGTVRVFVFPHSQGPQSANYRVKPTKVDYRLYCDDQVFQLYQRKRGNTWIFLRAPKGDDASYRAIESKGDRRRMREATFRAGINHECKASIALDKIGKDVQTHVGKVQSEGILGAEIYVISNRDVQSMRILDQWLNYVDTEEVLPLFEKLEAEYKVPKLDMVPWEDFPAIVRKVCQDRNLSSLRSLQSTQELDTILNILKDHNERVYLRDVVAHILSLEASSDFSLDRHTCASMILEYLPKAVFLTSTLFQSQTWAKSKSSLEDNLIHHAPNILRALILAVNEIAGFARQALSELLQELKRISLQDFAELVELIALTVRSPEFALDLLLEVLEPETSRLLVGRPTAIQRFTASLSGVALDHVDEAAGSRAELQESIKIDIQDHQDGYCITKSLLRIDSSLGAMLKVGDHVRLTVTNAAVNDPFSRPFSTDALVTKAEPGSATFRCFHNMPSYADQCAWNVTQCGSFVTTKACFDALTAFYTQQEGCCKIYALLLGLSNSDQIKLPNVSLPAEKSSTLNESQNAAVFAAMENLLTFIWGPPGTGKTHTIVIILRQLLSALPKSRILVTAPTHNAVDNLLRRFVSGEDVRKNGIVPLRVSTQLSKVASDLRSYTCDAMVGKDISSDHPARRKAQKRVTEARLIFTTCTGASLGLLRTENFDVVLVDEASQQTEPATLVPLVKGCSRAILVGDHVQLRATVQKNAALVGYDVSLFERHYNLPARKSIAKAMLDTQYRMHRSICDFSSREFYEGKLNTAVADDSRRLPLSQFPWPKENRMVWLECDSSEDLGRQSKANQGQVELCKRTVQLLTAPSQSGPGSAAGSATSMTVLTPYTRQKDALAAAIPSIEISSIDGFQGREADIIIFVTVRSNLSYDIGFLSDMRRLNVVMTRARSGIILIGNKATLTGVGANEVVDDSKKIWKRLIDRCEAVDTSALQLSQGHENLIE